MTSTPSGARIAWLTAGTLLAVMFTIWAGFSLAGHAVGSVTRDEHHVVRGKVSEVRIDAKTADIMLEPAAGPEVVVDTHAKGTLWLPKLKTEMDGGHLVLTGSCHDMTFGHCEALFVVRVPENMPVTVRTRSGDISANGLSGHVNIDAGSGDVELAGLSGGTRASVGAGDIAATRLGGRLVLETSSGDVDAVELTSDVVNARASSGDVFVDLAKVPTRVNVASSSGDVTISVPRHGREGYDTQVATSSGDRQLGVTNNPDSDSSLSAVTSSGDTAIRYR